ncbi:MAG: hypothetical protein P4L40_23120 [Terracidiphilus sp.]|nr:hypothetical protein [Terracidiphilus sp.]
MCVCVGVYLHDIVFATCDSVIAFVCMIQCLGVCECVCVCVSEATRRAARWAE